MRSMCRGVVCGFVVVCVCGGGGQAGQAQCQLAEQRAVETAAGAKKQVSELQVCLGVWGGGWGLEGEHAEPVLLP